MKVLALYRLSILVVLSVVITSCDNSAEEIDYTWLQGQWQRVDVEEGQQAFETWVMTEDQMKGIGCTMEGADTVFVEYLSIYKKSGKHYYSADVAHNPEAVSFEITPTNHGFVCVNEKHDFPNKISYTHDGDSMTVFISDMSEAKKRYFRFVRYQ